MESTVSRSSSALCVLEQSRPFQTSAVGAIIVGILDLAYAIVVYSPKRPILIPLTIASGILGHKAFEGGGQIVALGVVLHFFIALGAATVYYVASRKLRFLLWHPIPSGLTYGGLVYLFMHALVLPLSAVSHGDMPIVYKILDFVEHWFCVGLPIAMSARYYSGADILKT